MNRFLTTYSAGVLILLGAGCVPAAPVTRVVTQGTESAGGWVWFAEHETSYRRGGDRDAERIYFHLCNADRIPPCVRFASARTEDSAQFAAWLRTRRNPPTPAQPVSPEPAGTELRTAQPPPAPSPASPGTHAD